MKFKNLIEVTRYFSDEEVCRKHLEKIKWGNGPITCPKCSKTKVYWLKGTKQYICADKVCRKKFSVIVGTIFEKTQVPLYKWFIAIYLTTCRKKGVSSLQLSKDIGVTQNTAWFMIHRIREMLKDQSYQKVKSIFEIDETYIGGLDKNKHKSKRKGGTQGRSVKEKIPVLAILDRKNKKVYTEVIKDAKIGTIQPIIEKYVKKGSTIYTDEWWAYNNLHKNYKHERILHQSGEFVRDDVHTNNVEGYFSILKRGILGTYHWTSKKHLPRYRKEFEFRYNVIKSSQEDKFNQTLKGSLGRRLTYNSLISNL